MNSSDFLTPGPGTIRREADGGLAIEVPVTLRFEGDLVETSIRLDAVDVADAPAGRSLTFPVNPEEGYIDGSLYLGEVHNPVDVTRIDFGEEHDGTLRAALHGVVDFTFEGPEELGVRPFVLAVALRWEDTAAGAAPAGFTIPHHEQIDEWLYDGWRREGDAALETLGVAGWRGLCHETVRRLRDGALGLGETQNRLRALLEGMVAAFPEHRDSADYLREGAGPLLALEESDPPEARDAALARFFALHPNM